MIFKTKNSTYQVDFKNKQLRRLIGTEIPTGRTGQDGVWKQFHDIGPIEKGVPVFIAWKPINNYGVIEGTATSPIIEIFEEN